MNRDKKRMFQEKVDPQVVLTKMDDACVIYESLKDIWDDIEFTVEDIREYLDEL